MKIEEKTQSEISGISQWVRRLSECSQEEFLREIQQFES